jgi:hypothetical protein
MNARAKRCRAFLWRLDDCRLRNLSKCRCLRGGTDPAKDHANKQSDDPLPHCEIPYAGTGCKIGFNSCDFVAGEGLQKVKKCDAIRNKMSTSRGLIDFGALGRALGPNTKKNLGRTNWRAPKRETRI